MPPLISKLPLAQSFRPEYLSYYRLLPLEIADGVLAVAAAGEPNPDALADLEESFDLRVRLVPVAPEELEAGIRQAFASAESVTDLVKDLGEGDGRIVGPPDSPDVTDLRDLANQAPVIRYVNLLIREAYESRASDIHLEAAQEGLRVRLRIDGVLSPLPGPPPALQAAVVSRVKLLAELDIAERRAPQDGRIRVRLEDRELDLRAATVPTLHGESVVLRLLDRGGQPVELDQLGMDPGVYQAVRQLAQRPHGIVLSTGPTGSGKTTTLYAALGLRRLAEEKVITVEDPVEYQLAGVTQVPVHSRTGVTFGSALRSLLRQDPDVMMVGEMRDSETADMAVQAALTGHLVLSTLHTNDAVSALVRLADLKVEPYLIASTLDAVLAQRLVRRVCPECRERYQPDPAAVALLASKPVGNPRLERGAGCTACRNTGYKGRTGIFELLQVTEDMRRDISRSLDVEAVRSLARRNGMITLRENGWSKVAAGITTVEEVLRVTGD